MFQFIDIKSIFFSICHINIQHLIIIVKKTFFFQKNVQVLFNVYTKKVFFSFWNGEKRNSQSFEIPDVIGKCFERLRPRSVDKYF